MSARVRAQIQNQKFQAFDELVERILNDPNFTLIAVGTSFFVLILTFLLIRLITQSGAGSKYILLLGLSESGKTTLFGRLVAQRTLATVTSMKENVGSIKIGSKSVQLIDCPGFDRLRIQFFDTFKNKSKGIIFVIDSFQFLSNVRDVAEFLYIVLSDPMVSKNKLPILVACNKSDEPKAKSSKVILKQLEKEFNAIRETRTAALDTTDDTSSNCGLKVLKQAAKDFSWTDVKNPIDFVDISAISDDDDSLESIGTWLRKV